MSRRTNTTSDRTAQKQHSSKTVGRRRVLQAAGAIAVAGVSAHTAAAQTASPDSTVHASLEGAVCSSPTIVNRNIYIGSGGGIVYCLDGEFNENWSFSTDGDGIVSSPAVVNGTVYIGSRQPNLTGKVHAIDASTGNENWAFDTDDWVDSSPTVSNGVVYVGVFNNKFYALDADTGEIHWVNDYGGGFQSPTVVDGTVYTQTTSSLYAFDAASGDQLWSYSIGDTAVSSRARTNDVSVWSRPSPTVESGMVFAKLSTLSDGGVYAVSKYTGEKIWKCPELIHSTPTVADGTIYAGGYDEVCAIEAFNGEKNWTFDIGGRVVSSPTVAGNSICVGGPDGNLYVLESDGSKKQEFSGPSEDIVESSPTVKYGHAFHGTNEGHLFGWDVSDYTGRQSEGTRVGQRILGHHNG